MLKKSLVVFTILGAACAPTKDESKGVVDESEPPSIPTELGKGDGASQTVAVNVQSAHPYTNNLDKLYSVPLTGLPSCATDARLHFSVLRTEANYDFVTVEPTGAPTQEFDGTHDDTWTEWFPINATSVKVRLETDGSVTRHGFAVDKIEWDGSPICPAIFYPPCGAGTVDVSETPGTCECPVAPQCVNVDDVEIKHSTALGFNFRTHHAVGPVASETHPGPADGPETSVIGTIDVARLGELVERAADLGLLHGNGYDRPLSAGVARDELQIVAGAYTVTFTASEGAHDPAVQTLITDFEALFSCGTSTGGLTCDSGFTCQEGACVEDQGCFCPAIYQPVCSTSGITYSNGCAAGCANAAVAHDGECGIPGDTCGTILGLACQDDNRCRFGTSQFTYPFPDAGGTCVAANYCDAPTDCSHLAHIAVPGAWACNANTCAWNTGAVAWNPVTDGTFETAHPYANGTSVWKEISLPAGAQTMRLKTTDFSLEANYDFLEVWTWINGAWSRVKRYTGTAGPLGTDLFPGRYHYLRFVSDSSITKTGFRVDAEWR